MNAVFNSHFCYRDSCRKLCLYLTATNSDTCRLSILALAAFDCCHVGRCSVLTYIHYANGVSDKDMGIMQIIELQLMEKFEFCEKKKYM